MHNPVLYESHMHTPLCRHARGQPEEYAAVAHFRGLKGIIVTCHNPMPDGYEASCRMREDEFSLYQEMVARARDAYSGRVDVRLGLECDYLPGFEGYLEEQIASAPLNFVLGSVHPHLNGHKERFFTGNGREYHGLYFTHLAMAAETGLFDSLAHPDLVRIVSYEDWDANAILDDVQRALDRIAATGIAMEVNSTGLGRAPFEVHPVKEVLHEVIARGIPITVGSDAHAPHRVADGYENAFDAIEAAGGKSINIFLDRQRHEIPLEVARKGLPLLQAS